MPSVSLLPCISGLLNPSSQYAWETTQNKPLPFVLCIAHGYASCCNQLVSFLRPYIITLLSSAELRMYWYKVMLFLMMCMPQIISTHYQVTKQYGEGVLHGQQKISTPPKTIVVHVTYCIYVTTAFLDLYHTNIASIVVACMQKVVLDWGCDLE